MGWLSWWFQDTIQGYPRREWERVGIHSDKMLEAWWNLGARSPEHVAAWQRFASTPATAATWQACGQYSPYDAQRWIDLGFELYHVHAAHVRGWGRDEAVAWRASGFSLPEIDQWLLIKATPQEAGRLRQALEPSDVKKWVKRGFATASEVQEWAQIGLDPNLAQRWRKAGFTSAEALGWVAAGRDVAGAKQARSAGYDSAVIIALDQHDRPPSEVRDWYETGLTSSEIVGWVAAGFIPSSAREWHATGHEALREDPHLARRFVTVGLEPRTASPWIEAQIAPELVNEWVGAEFTVADAEHWSQRGFNPNSARAWRDAEFTPKTAKSWAGHGFKPADAHAWSLVETEAARAVGFRDAGFDVGSPEDRPWLATNLSGPEAAIWRKAGFQAEHTSRPLPEVVASSELGAGAALVLGLGASELSASTGRALEAIALGPLTDERLQFVLDLIPPADPEVGRTKAWLEAAGLGHAEGLTPNDLAAAGSSAFDDLVDAGTRTTDFLLEAATLASAQGEAYPLGRIAPERLEDDQLLALSHKDEAARRAFLEGREEAVDESPSSPFVTELKTLSQIRSGDTTPWIESPPSELARVVATGPLGSADLELLGSDTTVWRICASDVARFITGTDDPVIVPRTATQLVAWSLMDRTRESFRSWDWEAAATMAEQWAAVATDNASRAEALNCLAACRAQMGDIGAARSALDDAITTASSTSLLVNLAALLRDDRPSEAVAALARASDSADTPEATALAVDAVRAFFALPETTKPPKILTTVARATVVRPTTLEDHVLVLRYLVRFDGDRLAKDSRLASSPHRNTWEQRVRVAEAKGLVDYIKALGRAASDNNAPAWAEQERNELVADALRAIEEDESSETAAAAILLLMVDNGFVGDPGLNATLTCHAVRKILGSMQLGEDDPSDELLKSLKRARKQIKGLPHPERTESDEEISTCIDFFVAYRTEVVRAAIVNAAEAHDQLIDAYRASGGGWSANRALREASAEIQVPVKVCLEELEQAAKLVTGASVKEQVVSLRSGARELLKSLEGMAS